MEGESAGKDHLEDISVDGAITLVPCFILQCRARLDSSLRFARSDVEV